MNFSRNVKRTALSVALGMCVVGGVQAQSTTGGVYGVAPAGSTITISNNSGLSRTVTVGADGHYNLGNLPIGSYTVDAGSAGKKTVTVTVGGAADASFGGDATTLGTVTVTGASIPKVDVTTTSTSTTITSEQLQRLPLAHSAEAIALLSPGAVKGNSVYFGNVVSFGGSSVAENAYYINGFAVGNPMTNVGGYTLPYGAIEQQQTYTGGYSAKYGRSDGGVINQVGKSGSNDVHFGGQVTFAPRGLRSSNPNRYYPNKDFSGANSNANLPYKLILDGNGFPVLTDSATGNTIAYNPRTDTVAVKDNNSGTYIDGDGNETPINFTRSTTDKYQYAYADDKLPGTLYSRGNRNKSWESTYSGYISGPIIKDKLFAFLGAETTKDGSKGFPSAEGGSQSLHDSSDDPKIYAKVNWNINDSNMLEGTYMSEKYTYSGNYYGYDFDSNTESAALYNNGKATVPDPITQHDEIGILKYTSYLTDNLTFNATYGRSRQSYVSANPILAADIPYVSASSYALYANPAKMGADSPVSPTNITSTGSTNARDYTRGLRADLQWVLGDHTLTFGVDNMYYSSKNEGTTTPDGAAYYYYIYRSTGTVYQRHYSDASSMSENQKAEYIEDNWQITDNFLLTLGLRNDKFQNFNNLGQKYIDSGNQWAPRVGASWDVFGDSSLKIFANAGRYYLGLPNAVALRGASPSIFTQQNMSYTGIDANGVPTGLSPVGQLTYLNAEDGKQVDANVVTPKGLKSEYQDEYILGFEKTLGDNWKYGAKATYRDLKQAIDDICDTGPGGALMTKAAEEYPDLDLSTVSALGCYLANPSGATNTFRLMNLDADGNAIPGSYTNVTMSGSDWGWPSKMKRTYKSIDLFLEHPFDGKWEARLDYTWSKLQGNTEGPANSQTGQGSDSHDNGVSTSENWDVWQLMNGANGYLANDHRHQIKLYGAYAFNDQWLVSANLLIQSGSPNSCYGLYNPDGSIDETFYNYYGETPTDPVDYQEAYHTCLGQSSAPGKTYTPWIHKLDVGVQWSPAYFDHKLKLGLNVFNAFNEHSGTYYYGNGPQGASSESDPYTISNKYGMVQTFETPRYVQFTASFDY